MKLTPVFHPYATPAACAIVQSAQTSFGAHCRQPRPIALTAKDMNAACQKATYASQSVFQVVRERPKRVIKFLGSIWQVDHSMGPLGKPHPEVPARPTLIVQIPISTTAKRGNQHDTLITVQPDKKGRGRVTHFRIQQPVRVQASPQEGGKGRWQQQSFNYRGHRISDPMLIALRRLIKHFLIPPKQTGMTVLPEPPPTHFDGYEKGNGQGGQHPFTG